MDLIVPAALKATRVNLQLHFWIGKAQDSAENGFKLRKKKNSCTVYKVNTKVKLLPAITKEEKWDIPNI